MYKNQLQELAQRSCFNLPSYACTREGPDHAPRFKACVNFNGEVFESPTYCTTLRQAEHAAAEVALNNLSTRGPSRSLTARVLDETGVYKNLLQETAHRAGLKLPVYTTVRSGPGHVPVFTCSVELAGINFTGESAKTKKQAEKNAAIAAWSSLKTMPNLVSLFESSRNAREQQRIHHHHHHHHQNQVGGCGRRMVRGKRDINSSNISGSHFNYLHLPHDQQQRRVMDLLLSEEGFFPPSSSSSNSNTMSFVSLLPPPPPRTTSKILPPLLTTTIKPTPPTPTPTPTPTVQVKSQEVQPPLDPHDHQPVPSKSDASSSNVYGASPMYMIPPMVQVIKQEVQPTLDHQDHQLVASKPICSSRNIYGGGNPMQRIPPMVQVTKQDVQLPFDQDHQAVASKSNPVYNTPHEKQNPSSIRRNFVGPDQLMAAISSSINFQQHPTTSCSSRNMIMNKGFAPAVQIRSVIPVCAAAPVRPSPPEQLPSKSTPPPPPPPPTPTPTLVKAAEVVIVSSESTSSLSQLTSNLNDKLQL